MYFSKSQIVAVLKCMIYISQPSWYFFTHFSWKIPGYLSPLSEPLTPLDTAHHTTPHHTTAEEDREWCLKPNIRLDCSLVIARSPHLNQKTIDTGKCHQQLAAVWWTSTTRILDMTRRRRKLPCYYFKYNFQTRPDFKWIRAKFLRLSYGHKHRVIHFHFYTKKPRYPFLSSPSLLSLDILRIQFSGGN